jgi:alpha-beta hydrolase superfamily lysophospholipase
VKTALAALAVLLVGVPAASAATERPSYRSPTAGAASALQIREVRAPRPLQLRQRCVTAGERRRIVPFTAADRTRLIGLDLGVGLRAVVLAHQGGGGAPGNLCAWMPYARHLVARGYRVFVFDHRGRGSSGVAPKLDNYHRVDIDVVAAVGILRARGVKSVILGGASLGGDAVLAAATRIRPAVQGVMTFGAPTSYVRVDGLAAVRQLDVPLLFVSAADDASFADDARQLYDAARSTDKQLAIFPGAEHGAPLLRRQEVRAVVDAWIDAGTPSG